MKKAKVKFKGMSTDTGDSVTDRLTNDATATLWGKAKAGAKVKIRDGDTVIGTVKADSHGLWSITTTTLADGLHEFVAKAVKGGMVAKSKKYAVSVDTVAPDAPEITGYSDDSGATGDGITSDTMLQLTGTATAGAVVEIRNGATSLGKATADGTGNWVFNTATLPDGAYSFTARVVDTAGNAGTSAVLQVTVDQTPLPAPVISGFSDDSGTPGDHITNDQTLQLSGTAEPDSTIEIFDGATSLGTANVDGSGNWTINVGPLSNGAHVLTAVATDGAGNGSDTSLDFPVTIDTVAPAAPAITGFGQDGGTPGDFLTNDQTLLLIGTAEAGALIEIFDGALSLGTATADETGDWSFTTGTLGEGAHSFTAQQTDVAGNAGPASTATVITIDATPPAAPVISTANGIITDPTPTIVGTAEPGSIVTVSEAGTDFDTAIADVNGDWSITIPDQFTLEDGTHVLNVTATDAAGNVSEHSVVAFHVDTGPPPNFTLTVNLDIIPPTSANSVIAGNAATLNPTDVINGGSGTDTLKLSEAGNYDLSALDTFLNVEKLVVTNFLGGATNLTMRDDVDLIVSIIAQTGSGGTVQLATGSTEAVVIGDNFDFILATGQATIDLSASANSSVEITAGSLRLDDVFVAHTAGSDLIIDDSGSYDLTWVGTPTQLKGMWSVSLGGNAFLIVNEFVAGHLSGVSGSATDVMNTVDETLDLSDMVITGGLTITSSNSEGTVFTVDDAATALRILGGDGLDTIFAPTLTFTSGQRDQIFALGTVETITDASGTYELNP